MKRKMNKEKDGAIFAVPRIEGKSINIGNVHYGTCPACGALILKSESAESYEKSGGRVMCTQCAVDIAWKE